MQRKYEAKVKLCHMDTNNFMAYIKTEDICSEIAKDIETRFNTPNYESDRSLQAFNIPFFKDRTKLRSNWIKKR